MCTLATRLGQRYFTPGLMLPFAQAELTRARVCAWWLQRELLRSLLIHNPEVRCSWEAFLSHPWLATDGGSGALSR